MQLQTPRVGISNRIHPHISHNCYHLHGQREQKPGKMGGFQASSPIFVAANIPCLPVYHHLQRPRVDVRSRPRNPWVIHIYDSCNEVNPIMNIIHHPELLGWCKLTTMAAGIVYTDLFHCIFDCLNVSRIIDPWAKSALSTVLHISNCCEQRLYGCTPPLQCRLQYIPTLQLLKVTLEGSCRKHTPRK